MRRPLLDPQGLLSVLLARILAPPLFTLIFFLALLERFLARIVRGPRQRAAGMWEVRRKNYDAMLGDLAERYHAILKHQGKEAATVWYEAETLRSRVHLLWMQVTLALLRSVKFSEDTPPSGPGGETLNHQ